MQTKFIRSFFILLILALLCISGCAIKPTTMPTEGLHAMSWQERRAELLAVNNWTIHGVLSVNYGGKNTIANFDWNYAAPNYTINIYGPMNIGSAYIIKDQNGVTLLKPNGEKVHAGSPEILMAQQLGWSLPLGNLTYWIRALPAPSVAFNGKFDEYKHLIDLHQQTWNITYSNFAAVNGSKSDVDLPTTIYLNAENVRIKIKITRWDLMP